VPKVTAVRVTHRRGEHQGWCAERRSGPFNLKRCTNCSLDARAAKPEGGQLSGGEQQAVAIARASSPIQGPVIDECRSLAPIVIERIYEFIPRIVAQGVGVLLVEQDVTQALAVATRVHCLLEGKTRSWGCRRN